MKESFTGMSSRGGEYAFHKHHHEAGPIGYKAVAQVTLQEHHHDGRQIALHATDAFGHEAVCRLAVRKPESMPGIAMGLACGSSS